jgi:hypothetical protein
MGRRSKLMLLIKLICIRFPSSFINNVFNFSPQYSKLIQFYFKHALKSSRYARRMMRLLKLNEFNPEENMFVEKREHNINLDREVLDIYIVEPASRMHAGERLDKLTYGTTPRPSVLYDEVNYHKYGPEFLNDMKNYDPEVFDGVTLAFVTMPGAIGSTSRMFDGKTLVHEVNTKRNRAF